MIKTVKREIKVVVSDPKVQKEPVLDLRASCSHHDGEGGDGGAPPPHPVLVVRRWRGQRVGVTPGNPAPDVFLPFISITTLITGSL